MNREDEEESYRISRKYDRELNLAVGDFSRGSPNLNHQLMISFISGF